MTKRVLSIVAVTVMILTSGQAKEACDKNYYLPTWDHQAPTVDFGVFDLSKSDLTIIMPDNATKRKVMIFQNLLCMLEHTGTSILQTTG